MKIKPLTETNPYLKDSARRERLNKQSVRSSCGVEGIKASSKKTTKITRRPKNLFKKLRSKFASD